MRYIYAPLLPPQLYPTTKDTSHRHFLLARDTLRVLSPFRHLSQPFVGRVIFERRRQLSCQRLDTSSIIDHPILRLLRRSLPFKPSHIETIMPYCDRCDRSFKHWAAYRQHIADSSSHNECDDCDLDFDTWTGLKQHWVQSPRHDYCQYCDEHFDDQDDLIEHYEDEHYYCSDCNRVFTSERGLNDHYRESNKHHYCVSCDKLFASANGLKNHLNSSIHRPKDNMCPFRGCDKSFVSRGALVLHLESGACCSGIDRETVNKVVRKYDKKGIITDPSRLLTSGSSGNQNITYMATAASWNGDGYECYLCDKVHQSLAALNQHLASPRHQKKFYICRGPKCSQRFNTLSGLIQHVESEKCGILKIRAVRDAMDNVLGRMARITI
ncbi:unnamed protein product [Cyclocybe aegerita]|uniref:C2H2-type domain-containing protein n=1 Tax=Cyclocybe aegerita TaxID=1973307 RepID=A0A8S0WCF5_CYCAE|nr:unnamed protein product [Cyclocybe aegerita]